MMPLLKKEINSYLTSLIGYITITVFLVLNGLFLWVIHSSVNVFDSSLVTLDGLFFISPWIFLFLISAVTMKMFAEEKKSGTIEILLTKPISDMNIVLSKFFASLLIVVLSVLPTMVYMICLWYLGAPAGNLDIGGILGSYTGLICLGGVFCSIGIFASSLTDNQIISFIISILICLCVYWGFDVISMIPFLSKIDLLIQELGAAYHYESMSRGVIDTRDVIYFVSAALLFILLTKISLQSRNWKK